MTVTRLFASSFPVIVLGVSFFVPVYAGTPVGCNSDSSFSAYISERGCNANIDGEFIWFPSLKAYKVYVQELKLLRARR